MPPPLLSFLFGSRLPPHGSKETGGRVKPDRSGLTCGDCVKPAHNVGKLNMLSWAMACEVQSPLKPLVINDLRVVVSVSLGRLIPFCASVWFKLSLLCVGLVYTYFTGLLSLRRYNRDLMSYKSLNSNIFNCLTPCADIEWHGISSSLEECVKY